MDKCFYCKSFRIMFDQYSNDCVIGILEVGEFEKAVKQSFIGLLQQTNDTTEISFIIEWDGFKNSTATIAFYGNIKVASDCEILLLDWLVLDDKSDLGTSAYKDSLIMVSEPTLMDNFISPEQELPFVILPVTNQELSQIPEVE